MAGHDQTPEIERASPISSVNIDTIVETPLSQLNALSLARDAAQTALDNALVMPGEKAAAEADRDALLGGADNSYLPSETTASQPENTEQIDYAMQEFKELYGELTVFSVAWSLAKRSGRDVETLLKGQ